MMLISFVSLNFRSEIKAINHRKIPNYSDFFWIAVLYPISLSILNIPDWLIFRTFGKTIVSGLRHEPWAIKIIRRSSLSMISRALTLSVIDNAALFGNDACLAKFL